MSQSKVPIEAIRGLITDALAAAGLPREDATKCAELMGEADLTGADAHGVFRLPQYVRRLKAGGFNPKPGITVQRSAPATALVDGDNAMGHLVMSRAAETAISIAREMGVSWVGVRRSNHAGPAGLYAEMPAAQGMIGIYAAVANANHMAVWGGADPLLGTNPLAIGVPSGDGAMVLDMATTVVSYGTVKNYALQGKPMEKGWMVNTATGEDITDAKRAAEGLLLADRRLQGLRACRDARADRRPAQPRGVRARRDRLQCRRCERNQHRALHPRARHRALPAARGLQGRGRPPCSRAEGVEAATRCRRDPHAGRAAPRLPRGSRCATACRSAHRWWRSWTRWRGSWDSTKSRTSS